MKFTILDVVQTPDGRGTVAEFREGNEGQEVKVFINRTAPFWYYEHELTKI